MENDLIFDNFARHIALSPDEKKFVSPLLEPRRVKAREYLLKADEICRYSFFVTAGCLKSFTLDEGGHEHVLGFAPPDWWMADLYSLFAQRPGVLYIQASEPSDVLLLSKQNQEQLYRNIPKFERFFRILTENALVSYQQRLLDNLSLNAEARYQNFCQKYPSLIHCLPQKDIASYIGVTPEFFSKMRARLLRNA